MRILVTGAGGFIGGRVCSLAFQAGHEVLAMTRPGRDKTTYPMATAHVYGELPYDLPAHAFKEIDAVVHCAAVLRSDQSGQSQAVNLEGTRTLLEMVRRNSATARFVFISTQSVHGKSNSSYARTKREGESLVKASGLQYTIIRPGLVYGPGPAGLYARMRETILKLPVLPLLGGGKALVQPLHVDDLAQAILNALTLKETVNGEYNLGDSEGLSLRDFMQHVARSETGKKKFAVPVPLAPLKSVTALAEKARIPFPINSDNLQGLEHVQRMETADSHSVLGVEPRPLVEGLSQNRAPSLPFGIGAVPVRVLLVGAGKIGIVHALNLIRREGATLAGIVDPSSKAARMYRSMGLGQCHESLAEGIRATHPDAVVIATPASTHLELTSDCCHRGISVLVEKPLAVNPVQLEEYASLKCQYSHGTIVTGYMAAQYPHLDDVVEILASEKLGKLQGVKAVVVQTHIVAPKPVRWEMVRAKSGGGVVINYAGHAISILRRILPSLTVHNMVSWPIHSVDVEDVAIMELSAGDLPGWLFTTWSIEGYPRPQMKLTFRCEQGDVILENGYACIVRDGKIAWLRTQRDYEVGYNAAPDYTGAGFAREHENFLRRVRHADDIQPGSNPSQMPVELHEGISVEAWIHDVYERFRPGHGPQQIDGMPTEFDQLMQRLPGGAR